MTESDANARPSVTAPIDDELGVRAADICARALGFRDALDIQQLKSAKRKSAVYRLQGAGPDGRNVIAKTGDWRTLTNEYVIYSEVLAHLPVETLDCYGFVEDAISDSRRAWLFLEDAGDTELSTAHHDRELVAHWLGRVHAWSAQTRAESALEPRTSAYFLSVARAALRSLQTGLANPVASPRISESLTRLERRCRSLIESWDYVAWILRTVPPTLVHGGLASKNVRVRDAPDGPAVLLFDWEAGGWGYPIADLSRVDMPTYVRTYGDRTGRLLRRRRLLDYQRYGAVFWCLAAVPGEAESLVAPWIGRLEGKLGFYAEQVEAAFDGPVSEGAEW